MTDTALAIPRHSMVRVDPVAWDALLAERLDLDTPLLRDWVRRGFPLVARRPICDEGGIGLPLGLPLPPSAGRHRIGLSLPRAAMVGVSPPPLLIEAATVAPAGWQTTIDALLGIDPAVRCFGSLAWQFLTGLRYLTDSSDLDLLWQVPGPPQADALAARLDAVVTEDAGAGADAQGDGSGIMEQAAGKHAKGRAVRIDGEMIAPSGLAVQWREWASGTPELLAKAPDGTRLVSREALFR